VKKLRFHPQFVRLAGFFPTPGGDVSTDRRRDPLVLQLAVGLNQTARRGNWYKRALSRASKT